MRALTQPPLAPIICAACCRAACGLGRRCCRLTFFHHIFHHFFLPDPWFMLPG